MGDSTSIVILVHLAISVGHFSGVVAGADDAGERVKVGIAVASLEI